MNEFKCSICDLTFPHTHGQVTTPAGHVVEAIISEATGHPRAEVRDSETGEVIFPAIKGPLQVIEGGRAALQSKGEGQP